MRLAQKLANNKNPQFSFDHNEFKWKWSTHEYLGIIARISAGLGKTKKLMDYYFYGQISRPGSFFSSKSIIFEV